LRRHVKYVRGGASFRLTIHTSATHPTFIGGLG
jgi:hypothetical protein